MGKRCTECTSQNCWWRRLRCKPSPSTKRISLAPDCRRQHLRRHAAGAVVAHVSQLYFQVL